MCAGDKACKSCAAKSAVSGIGKRRGRKVRRTRSRNRRSKSISSTIKGFKNMDFVKSTLKILAPAAAGVAGYLAAKAINNIPTGKDAKTGADTTLGSNALLSGGIKIAVAAFAPGLLGKKVPMLNEVSIGVGMAGLTDIAKALLPPEFATKIGIAGPQYGGGLHGILPRRTGNAIAGNLTRIGCSDKTETAMYA
jgi:hypothetical protein